MPPTFKKPDSYKNVTSTSFKKIKSKYDNSFIDNLILSFKDFFSYKY